MAQNTYISLAQPGWGDRLDEEDVLDSSTYAQRISESDPPNVTNAPVVFTSCCGNFVPDVWTVPPHLSGIPGSAFEMLPISARSVFSNPDLAVRICAFCSSLANVCFDSNGKIERVFCESCITIISLTPSYACRCGCKKHVDKVGKPSALCSTCHKAQTRQPKNKYQQKFGVVLC